MNNLRKAIISYCKKNKISQARFSAMAGINKATIYKFLSKERDMTDENISKVQVLLADEDRESEYELHTKGARHDGVKR